MIYLTTGANGAGKTLCTLLDVRAQQVKENRPVYFNGFEMDVGKQAEFGWLPFDPRKWQDLPDGSICIMDECQNEFPVRGAGSPVPPYINAIAQFRRKRGFDFWMVTPHPRMIDIAVRSLIGPPSWHRHFKRASLGDMVSVIRWDAVNMQCDKNGSGASGEITMRRFPKEVYGWYKSASLHTAKPRIPRAFLVVAAAVVLVPVLAWFAYGKFKASGAMGDKALAAAAASGSASPAVKPVPRPVGSPGGPVAVLSPSDYVASRVARVEGLPYTAPAYDGITQPQQAPYPAACISGVRPGTKVAVCECWSQQGTRLMTPVELCTQIAAKGFFMEWAAVGRAGGLQGLAPGGVGSGVSGPLSVPVRPAAGRPVVPVVAADAEGALVVADVTQAEHDGANIGAIRANQRRLK
jgi:zona occludens toxin